MYGLAFQLSTVLLHTAQLYSNFKVPKCFTFLATLLTVLNSQNSRTALKKMYGSVCDQKTKRPIKNYYEYMY
jgi:hypothetical protein